MSLGCSGGAPVGSASARPAADFVEMEGDWNDVEPAAKVGLSQVGVSIVRIDREESGVVRFHLRTPKDEPGLLVVERVAQEPGEDPVAVRLSCTLGRFGDAAAERELLARVAERLEQLRGVEVSPLGS